MDAKTSNHDPGARKAQERREGDPVPFMRGVAVGLLLELALLAVALMIWFAA